MGLPNATEARPFYQSALQRFEDAEYLLAANRTTGVYLAGYSVECMMKALILANAPAGRRVEILGHFRGGRGHDYDWLRARYFEQGGPPFPTDIARQFSFVDSWSTDLRYRAGALNPRDAEVFLRAARAILDWADGRL
jgi:hypothetical protein